jgi:hypothetical protein
MRIGFTLLAVVLGASTAAAQSHGGLTDDMPTPSIGLPLPHIGLPLPPMGLPLPPMGLPPAPSRPSDRSSILQRPERFERSERSERSHPTSLIFFGWPYFPTAEFPASPLPSPPARPKQATGRLLLSLHSGVDPQMFVDGYYIGLFSDFAGALTLDVGAHTIELREEGFRDERVDVKIPDGTITYDVVLKPSEAAPVPVVAPVAAPSPPPPPTTIYVVPGCYVGNVAPQQVKLPAGCDANAAIAFPSR